MRTKLQEVVAEIGAEESVMRKADAAGVAL
jgi:hypothetical protein